MQEQFETFFANIISVSIIDIPKKSELLMAFIRFSTLINQKFGQPPNGYKDKSNSLVDWTISFDIESNLKGYRNATQ